MIARIQEIERRLEELLEDNIDLRRRLSAAFDRINQLGGGLGVLFGPSSAVSIARADGSITARSGTTIGTGNANLSHASAGTLTEGTTAVVVKNILNKTIANDSWLIVVRDPDWWWIVAVADCANLS
jgi:hypothetical protein